MADLDAALMQQVLHIWKRQRKSAVQHHGQSYDLGARLEVAKGAAFCHSTKLRNHPARLNPVSSDGTSTRLRIRPAGLNSGSTQQNVIQTIEDRR